MRSDNAGGGRTQNCPSYAHKNIDNSNGNRIMWIVIMWYLLSFINIPPHAAGDLKIVHLMPIITLIIVISIVIIL